MIQILPDVRITGDFVGVIIISGRPTYAVILRYEGSGNKIRDKLMLRIL